MITPPLAFVRSDEQEMESYLHVGRSLCGHDGVIHGGMLATILDEAMGRMVRGGWGVRGREVSISNFSQLK